MHERFPSRPMESPDRVSPQPVGLYDAERYFYDKETHLLDYLKVLSKRRWTAVAVLLVVFLAATVYAFARTPIYEARVRLMIEVDNPNIVQFQQVREERQLDDYYETQYQLLQSRSLVRETLDELDLWDDRDFLGVTD